MSKGNRGKPKSHALSSKGIQQQRSFGSNIMSYPRIKSVNIENGKITLVERLQAKHQIDVDEYTLDDVDMVFGNKDKQRIVYPFDTTANCKVYDAKRRVGNIKRLECDKSFGSHSIARADELPPPIPGMEGPFRYKDGRILYYDPREGKYYDRGQDHYLEMNEIPL